jgi:hypothetical protein
MLPPRSDENDDWNLFYGSSCELTGIDRMGMIRKFSDPVNLFIPVHHPIQGGSLILYLQRLYTSFFLFGMVGPAGLEPATSSTPRKRASQAALRPDINLQGTLQVGATIFFNDIVAPSVERPLRGLWHANVGDKLVIFHV